ncbi:hypothetical protein C1645_818498 [Glomus cerebriforme]|uniref:F-box domain-containing protein n=1 Tax=Glomus cerebriforme TaxID=658196 RepID=A0A397TCT3_9GLOM|nr:hypothetical protein C1645_818498 [Glomus cerebriforme]
MLKLNDDILYYIFQELNDDGNSLFTCLLVNKLWCELTVPILWRFPLKYIQINNKNRTRLLFKIILLHLSEHSIKLLMDINIKIISAEKPKQKLSFNYVSFCKYLGIYKIFIILDLGSHLCCNQKRCLSQEIYKLFINECSNIIYLNSDELIYPLYQYPGANICLSNLSELDCKSNLESSVFYGLAKICRLIEKIHITFTVDNLGLTKLIEAQKHIKYIRINNFSVGYEYGKMTQALEKHAHSILYLELVINETYSCFHLPNLINLQSLIIVSVNEEPFHSLGQLFVKHLMTRVYYNLQILELTRIPLRVAANIIKNTNGNIWKIKIRTSKFNHSKEYIQSIYKYCPNIKITSVLLNNRNLDELKNLFINCIHLEALDVIVINENGRYEDNYEKFLDLLVKFAPITLYKLHINPFFYSKQSLKLFFNNWKGRKILHLYDHSGNWSELIQNNEEIVGYRDCKDFWNVENYTKITWYDEF